MKLLFLILLSSSILFSQERQLILGCYLEKDNAKRAIERLNKILNSDVSIKKLVKRDSLKSELKQVEGYGVVTLSHFDTYAQLFLGLYLLKHYYHDAYVLDYPFSKKVIKEKLIVPETKVEKTKENIVIKDITKKEIVKEEVETKVIPKIEETVNVEVVVEPKKVEVIKEVVKNEEPQSFKEEESDNEEILVTEVKDDNYIIYGLVSVIVLILISIGLFVYLKSEKEEVDEFDFKS